jgi:hypothetical protein
MYTKRDQEVLLRLKNFDNETLSDIYDHLQDVGDLTLKSSIELPMWLALMNTSRLSLLIQDEINERIQAGDTEHLEDYSVGV